MSFTFRHTVLSVRVVAMVIAGFAAGTVDVIAAEVSWTEQPKTRSDSILVKDQITSGEDTKLSAPADAQHNQIIASIHHLLRDHPALLALESERHGLIERSQSLGALPDPVVSLGINNLSISSPSFDEFLPTNKMIGIRQEFPNRKVLSAKTDQAQAQAEAVKQKIIAKREALTADVIEHLLQLGRIDQQQQLAQRQLLKYGELTEVVESEIEAGNPSVFRLAEIDAERARVSGVLNNLNAERLSHEARLVALTGTIPSMEITQLNYHQEWSGEYDDFHLVRIAKAELSGIKELLKISDASSFRRWGVQLAYQQREEGDTFKGDDWVSGQVFFTVPVWNAQSQAPEQRAATAVVEAARQNLLLAQRTALAEYTALTARWESKAENINLLQSQLVAVQDKIETQTTSYEAGIGFFAPIVDGDIALLKLRAEIAAEQALMHSHRARLNSLLISSVNYE
jgi:outer membrane protein TolC